MFGESYSDLIVRIILLLDPTESVNKMTSNNLIEFHSKQCKDDKHLNCESRWEGLGFTILCTCTCHKEERGVTLVARPVSNAAGIITGSSHNDV